MDRHDTQVEPQPKEPPVAPAAASGLDRALRILFVALGPISLVGYLLVHTWLNLTGACYNLVIESSLNRLTGKPISLPNWTVYALSPLIVLLAPLAAMVHGAVGLSRASAAGAVRLGRWQTGVQAPRFAGAIGAIWFLAAAWIAIACIHPATGWRLLGRDVPGLEPYNEAVDLRYTLGQLPGPMQQRRQLLASDSPQATQTLQRLLDAAPEHVAILRTYLQTDEVILAELYAYPAVQRYIAGLPWYYQLPTQSSDGQGRTFLLLGCLAFSGLLLVRWPGLGIIARGGPIGLGQYVVRVGLALTVTIAAFTGDGPTMEIRAQQATIVLVLAMIAALLWWLTFKASQYWRLPRQYSPFLAMRLLQRKRIAFFSLGAVTLCVAMVLIVISVMGGFLDMVRDRSHRLVGDLVMDNGTVNGFPYYQEFIDRIGTWPEIQAATPVIQTFSVMQLPDERTKAVHLVGMRLDEIDQVNGFKGNLFYEQWYPGTTYLGEQAQPLYGVNAQGVPFLPAEFEQALAASPAWKELQQDPKAARKYLRIPPRYLEDAAFSGPGIFARNLSPDEMDRDWINKPAWSGSKRPGIIIGRDLIAQRLPSGEYYRFQKYPRGCEIRLTIVPLSRDKATISIEGPKYPSFRYVDDSRTGVYEIDSTSVYVDFAILQQMLGMDGGKRVRKPDADPASLALPDTIPPRASQILIKAAPGQDLYALRDKIQQAWGQFIWDMDTQLDGVDYRLMSLVTASTWEQMQAAFISAVEKEKALMLILFGVISVVAIFLILCIFYMIVMEKTRDIGIIKSVGGSAGGVAAVFLSYGAAIGIVGAILGVTLGTVFVHHINEIQDWLASLHPELRVWKADVYSFDTIPSVVKFGDAATIAVIAVFASIVGALVPALIAARRHPVESLRYE